MPNRHIITVKGAGKAGGLLPAYRCKLQVLGPDDIVHEKQLVLIGDRNKIEGWTTISSGSLWIGKTVAEICAEAGRTIEIAERCAEEPLKRLFRDNNDKWSVEPVRYLGKWFDGSDAYESTSNNYTHLVRLEKDGKASFVSDPDKAARLRYIPDYLATHNNDEGTSNTEEDPGHSLSPGQ